MKRSIYTFWFFLICISAFNQVKLPRLISDGMVLQRNQKVKIWGWASPQEKITISFNNKTYSTITDSNGNWNVMFPPMKASGPFELVINASNQIVVKNILIGDVWICSGQSNMELDMKRVKDKYKSVIEGSENKNIRHFLVPDQYDFKQAHHDLDGGVWESANPKNVLSFSAVAYFFAKELYEKYQVPIGLINASLGGSPAEAWISEDALTAFPDLYQEAQRFKNDKFIEEIENSDRTRISNWYRDLNSKDSGVNQWHDPALHDSDWPEMKIPGYWANGELGNVNGVVWFRKKIMLPKSMTQKKATLWLGCIVDADSVFINGKFIGTTSYQYPPRKYEIGADVLKEGENTIAIRVINSSGRGGFVPDKPYFLAADSDTLDLKGSWKFKQGATMPALGSQTFIRWKPVGLFNRMIAPLLNYGIKGVIWYQGESNTRNPTEYETLFPAMIQNWREKWKQGNFPFLYVQLANFMETSPQPTESNWAALRHAQSKALSIPNTGMAVTIDIGEWNDIHPLNKEDVGKRLALGAQCIAYGDKKIVFSGPSYKSHTIKNNKIIISFANTGSGLLSKGNTELKYFTIAGADKKFVWAKAKIEGNKIVVWSDEIANPVIVRYAWADNPEGANLYNIEGLPASSFTTENK